MPVSLMFYSGKADLWEPRQAIMTSIIERVDEIVRIVLRVFQRSSNLALCAAMASAEADCKLKASRASFKRTLPNIVTPNPPIK